MCFFSHKPDKFGGLHNSQQLFSWVLVHFYNTVDLAHEPEARDKANGACEKEEEEDHNDGVSKV